MKERAEKRPKITIKQIREMSDHWPVDNHKALQIAAKLTGHSWTILVKLHEYLIINEIVIPDRMPYRNSESRDQRAFRPKQLVPVVTIGSDIREETLSQGFTMRRNRERLINLLISNGFLKGRSEAA